MLESLRVQRLWIVVLLTLVSSTTCLQSATATSPGPNFERDQLVAWCIVPFDAAKRNPQQRAEMLKEIGISRCAYDWRQEHVPTFEAEILEYKKQGIEYFAFWGVQEEAYKLFAKYDLHPQIWQTLTDPKLDSQQKNVDAAVEKMIPLAKRTQGMKCKLGLYNHGGWGGEPQNMVAVCEKLHTLGYTNVGIVYNFHHGHDHISDWATVLKLMQPYLLCLNLNGMNDEAKPKILGIAHGTHEMEMIRIVIESGYKGPIGIIGHRENLDARDALIENRDGLAWVLKQIEKPGSGGLKPPAAEPPLVKPTAQTIPLAPPSISGYEKGVSPGDDKRRSPPITVKVKARLNTAENFNILVASDTKKSSTHWELFTMKGNGNLTAYLPGQQPDHVHSKAMICDGQVHYLAMTYASDIVKLYVDGQEVAAQEIKPNPKLPVVKGNFAIGRLVEGGFCCDGIIEWVHLSKTIRQITPESCQIRERDIDVIHDTIFSISATSIVPTTSSAPVIIPPKELSYSPELISELIATSAIKGDPVKGAVVFANAKGACISCHKVGRHGGTVGPELSKITQVRDLKSIVESILWPQREVKPEYVVHQILLDDGKSISGYKQAEDDKQLTIRDPAHGKLTVISKENVLDVVSGSTLMPSGLTASMSHQQQLDLIRFLSDLGKNNQPLTEELDSTLEIAQVHGAVEFPLVIEPMDPARWPNYTSPVNRGRIYDFYTKQAEYFRQQKLVPMLLTSFTGLDGGKQGHWGNQSETTWKNERWNSTDLGRLQAGVFHADKLTVPRGVCVRIGDQQEMSVCFNPDKLTYDAVWCGGFVSFSPVRHGFMNGLLLQGTLVEQQPTGTAPTEPFVYHGYYRAGNRIVFSYKIGAVEYLDSPWVQDGKFVREVAVADQHPLREVFKGGTTQWPQVLETKITPGSDRPYAVDTIELPTENPWQALIFCSGQDFLPDGSALICTMQGDVWHVSGLGADPTKPAVAKWKRFASGLHQALGLVVSADGIYVQGRDQLTRLTDLNHDGEADFYECYSNAFETSTAGHDFICGLQRDTQGNFYTASGNQGIVKISPDGKQATVIATGFRNPDGLGLMPNGTLTVPCSEGEWTPASMICAVPTDPSMVDGKSKIPHYGYRGPINGETPTFPLAYVPRGMDNSSGEEVFINSSKWGPLQNQLVHFSFGMGSAFVVLQDEVQGQKQGAVIPFAADFLAGAHRGRFSPIDGQLYVSGMAGWGTYTHNDGSFQRVRYTGDAVQIPVGYHVYQNGVRVQFAEPVDSSFAANTKNHFAQCWNYRYSGAYGSPEFSPSHQGVRGHDPLVIKSVQILPDGHSIFVELPDLQPVSQLHLRLRVNPPEQFLSASPTGSGHDMFITVHKLDTPFTDYASYQPVEKIIAAHPLLVALAMNAKRIPNRWATKKGEGRRITITTDKNLTFNTPEFEVVAKEKIALKFQNPDVVPHNWVLVKPGTLRTVGEMANALIADPEAYFRQYIPESPDVIVFTDIISPGEQQVIYFEAPATPGRYPYLCTFPGHWMVMNGVMVVK
jgi:putative heme-binding domain-containing protein